MADSRILLALSTVLAVALLAVQTLRLWWSKAGPRRRLAALRTRALLGEEEAEGLLRGLGYRIEARQPRATLGYTLDGRSVDVDVRADLLLRRGGTRFVAEVKTGRKATKLQNRHTRRQLLEYAHAFDAEGILLIDADERTVHMVEVPRRRPRRGTSAGFVFAWLLGAVGGATITLLYIEIAGWM